MAARIPSTGGCGPGETSGAHTISHCATQRLLVHTGPVSGGFVSVGPMILRSAQEPWLLEPGGVTAQAASVDFAFFAFVCVCVQN